MQVIAHKRLQFHKSTVAEHPVSKEKHHLIEESFTVAPSSAPQVVPDWIKGDALFALAVKDKSIIPVAILTEDEEPEKPSKPSKQKQSETGLSNGWGK